MFHIAVCDCGTIFEDVTALQLQCSSIYPSDSQQSCPESGGASPRSLDDDDDDDRDVKEKELQTEALLCAFETLGKAWPRNSQTQGEFFFRTDTTGPLFRWNKFISYILHCVCVW